MSVYLYWCYTITSAVLNSSLFIVRDFRYKKWNHIKRDTNYTAKSFISIYLLNTLIKVHGPLGGKVHSSVCRCMTVRVLRCWRWTVWWARAGHSQTQDSAHSPLRESHLKYKQKNVSYFKKKPDKEDMSKSEKDFPKVGTWLRSVLLQMLPSVNGSTSCGETNLWKVSSSFGNWNMTYHVHRSMSLIIYGGWKEITRTLE